MRAAACVSPSARRRITAPRKAFLETGIEFAHRRVTVDLPSDLDLSAEKKKEIAEAAGAAALVEDEKQQGRG